MIFRQLLLSNHQSQAKATVEVIIREELSISRCTILPAAGRPKTSKRRRQPILTLRFPPGQCREAATTIEPRVPAGPVAVATAGQPGAYIRMRHLKPIRFCMLTISLMVLLLQARPLTSFYIMAPGFQQLEQNSRLLFKYTD